jgi:hypothetical protein
MGFPMIKVILRRLETLEAEPSAVFFWRVRHRSRLFLSDPDERASGSV